MHQICSQAKQSDSGLVRVQAAAPPSRACRARCSCLLARASFLLKIRCFRGNFLLPALHAHILHMQAIWHIPAPQADKGTGREPGWESAGTRHKPSPWGCKAQVPAYSSLSSSRGEVCSPVISSWSKADCPGALLGSELLAMTHSPRMILGDRSSHVEMLNAFMCEFLFPSVVLVLVLPGPWLWTPPLLISL